MSRMIGRQHKMQFVSPGHLPVARRAEGILRGPCPVLKSGDRLSVLKRARKRKIVYVDLGGSDELCLDCRRHGQRPVRAPDRIL